MVDDLTRLHNVRGGFDLLVDYGTLDDLGVKQRDEYVRRVVPLALPGSRFLLWCFEWELRPWERLLTSVLPVGKLALAPGEAERRFARDFQTVDDRHIRASSTTPPSCGNGPPPPSCPHRRRGPGVAHRIE